MKKAFILIIGIFTCTFLFFGGKAFLNFLDELLIFASDSYDKASTTGSFGFKRTPENLELVNSYLKVNNSFIENLSKEINTENDIKNIENLVNGFPSYKYYYSANLKLKNAIFEGIPYLLNNTVNISNAELESFFNDNLDYLEKTFGITSLSQLNAIISNLSSLGVADITYAEIVENSVMYNPYGQSTSFGINIGSQPDNCIYFSVNAYHGYDTKNQKAPVIVFKALGGMS